MAFYKIQWKTAAERDLRRLPKNVVPLILDAIEQLAENPYNNVKKLKGVKNLFRSRVGDYRIIYEIKNQALIVQIVHVGDRKDIYKN